MVTATFVGRHRLGLMMAFTVTAMVLVASLLAVGTAKADEVCTGASNIVDAGTYYIVSGTKGDDTIDCSGADKSVEIRGSWGNDSLTGSGYADALLGGWGDDTLNGGAGDDLLQGGHGADAHDGGGDTDVCLGGHAWDTFTNCETEDQGQA